MKLKLSADQTKIVGKILTWFKTPGDHQFITLGGYAGTGKTTLVSFLRKELNRKNKNLKVAFCSYTGKATQVIKTKLKESEAEFEQDSVSTIHSLIYSPVVNNHDVIIGWTLKSQLPADLIIIDEASMVDRKIWQDLLSFHTPIIAVGDHGQLPPIKEGFNLMEKPMLKLEKIHRQARENPIIQLSIIAREQGKIPEGNFGKNILKILRNSPEAEETVKDLLLDYDRDALVLCGYNSTRVKINKFIRQNQGFESEEPEVGDRVICLRNNHIAGIYNGMLGTINSIFPKNPDWYLANISMDNKKEAYDGLIYRKQFGRKDSLNFTEERQAVKKGDLFDFGYALTVHKAQGSEAKRVILFEERFGRMDDITWKKWLYTAITRAQEELFIIGRE